VNDGYGDATFARQHAPKMQQQVWLASDQGK